MKSFPCFLLIFLTAVVAHAQPPVEAPVEKPESTSRFKGVRRAVLVGVNEYQFLHPLNYAGEDVVALGKVLVNSGFDEKNVVVIHDKAARSLQPDKQKIMKQIELTLANAQKEDLVFFVFCMHGVRIGGKTYLAPYEATPPQFDGDTKNIATFIPIDWVYEQMNACPAAMKLIMVDACQERIFEGDTRSLNPAQKRLQTMAALEAPKGIMQLVACAPGEFSHESEKLKHGVYSYYVLEALSGKADSNHDGIVTLKELDLYVSRETNAYVRENYKRTQRPSIRGEMEGDLPLTEAEKFDRITFPNDIDRLDRAIERLNEGGILTIQPGVHRITEPLTIDKDIQIVGATGDPKDVTIEYVGEVIFGKSDETPEAPAIAGCIDLMAENARLQGITILVRTGFERKDLSGGKDRVYLIPAVRIPKGKSVLHKCFISSDTGDGVKIDGPSTDPELIQCEMLECFGSGIRLHQGKGTFKNCKLYRNEMPGLVVSSDSDPKVFECIFCDGKDFGISVRESGKGTFEKCHVYGNTKAGIYVSDGGDPTVRNCKVYDGKENGIEIYSGGKGTFEECDIYNNTKPGIVVLGDPTVRKCKIYDGKDNGIIVYGKKGTFESCEVYGNTKAGFAVSGKNTNPVVRNCKFYNGKGFGIFTNFAGGGTFENCEVYGNTATGIAVDNGSAPTVRGCKIYNGKHGGICFQSKSKGVVEKCKVYGNAKTGITVFSESNPTIRSCDILNNKKYGINIFRGEGTYERNTLANNAKGNWDINSAGQIRREGNTPNQ